jgi:hypothetical protein
MLFSFYTISKVIKNKKEKIEKVGFEDCINQYGSFSGIIISV